MITHLRGTLTDKAPTRAVVDVGGVGYEVFISLATFEALPEAGAQAHILAHTYVREDRWELFGFTEAPERDMFQLLIGVSGIGPNSALMILSGMSVADLSRAILEERVADLTRVRGVGPKTAQRVVVELKDRVRLPADGSADRSAGSDSDPVADEAMLALDALGFSGPAARKAVGAVRKKLGDGEVTVQALIKGALQER